MIPKHLYLNKALYAISPNFLDKPMTVWLNEQQPLIFNAEQVKSLSKKTSMIKY